MIKTRPMIRNSAVIILLAALLSLMSACPAEKSPAANNSAAKSETTRGPENKEANQSNQSGLSNNANALSDKNTNAGQTANRSVSDEESPQTVVANLYKAGKTKSVGEMNKRELERYFNDELTGLILKAGKEENGLNFDVLYYAQDTEIKNFQITEEPTDNPILWNVMVSFTNFGKKEKFTYEVMNVERGRRITEIRYTDGTTLSEILQAD